MFQINLFIVIVTTCLLALWASVNAWPFLVLIVVFMTALGYSAIESLGQSLNVGQLKKRKLYVIHGQGSFVANGEMKKKVYFAGTRCDKIVAVTLPVDLPDSIVGFWITNNYNALGQRIFGEGAILVQPTNEKISFYWKEKNETKK